MKAFNRLILFLVLIPTLGFAQTKKTFNDNYFTKGDIIRVPNLDIELLNGEKNVTDDSLAALVNFLKTHPSLKVEIACHTDSRGNTAGNLQSSQYRADGIKKYLIKNENIPADKLKSKGYGESKLIIPDGTIAQAKTTEEKEKLHLINRRTELIVLEGTSGTKSTNTPVSDKNIPKKKKNISGNLIYGENSTLLANTKIDILNEKKEVVKSTTTNALGAFAFKGVETDEYYVQKSEDGSTPLKPNTKVTITNKDGKTIQTTTTSDKGDFIFAFKGENKAALDVEYHDLRFDLKGKMVKKDNSTSANNTVNLVNEKGEKVANTNSDADGNFQFSDLRANQDDLFTLNNPDTKFITFEKLYLADENGNIIRELPLTDGEFKLDFDEAATNNDPWLKVMDLKNSNKKDNIKIIENIYYNKGDYQLLPEAQLKLDKLVYIMKKDPQLVVSLSSHTDSRASTESNQKLSDQRAKVAVDYIISKGIPKDHVSGKGYGESSLINKCADGVMCTEEEHAKNRRIEFEISRK